MKNCQFDLAARIQDKHWWFVGRRDIVTAVVLSLVSPHENKTIVDIGCGTGYNLDSLSHYYNCVGIDVDQHSIFLARNQFSSPMFINCTDPIEVIKRLDTRVDMFLLLDVLEHLSDDRAFLTNLTIVMDSGSFLLITVPANMSLWSPHDENHGHYRRYAKKDLYALLRCSSVEIVFVSYFNTILYPIIRLIRWYTNFKGREWGEAGTDLSMPPKILNAILAKILSLEKTRILNELNQKSMNCPSNGVSLIALIKKI